MLSGSAHTNGGRSLNVSSSIRAVTANVQHQAMTLEQTREGGERAEHQQRVGSTPNARMRDIVESGPDGNTAERAGGPSEQ